MDTQKIVQTALAVGYLGGLVAVFIFKGTYSDVKEILPRMSVSEKRQDVFEKQTETYKAEAARINEQSQATLSNVLKEVSALLSNHEAQLAVIQHRIARSEVEQSDMATDIKTLLRIAHSDEMRRK
jgi:hypothetical protein